MSSGNTKLKTPFFFYFCILYLGSFHLWLYDQYKCWACFFFFFFFFFFFLFFFWDGGGGACGGGCLWGEGGGGSWYVWQVSLIVSFLQTELPV